MSVRQNHLVMFGIKIPYIKIPDDNEEFDYFLYNNHNPLKYGEKIDYDKIYMLSDNYCGSYTVVGFVIDITDEYSGFNGFVEMGIQNRETLLLSKLIQFLEQDDFKGIVPEELPEPELLVFTHHS